MTVHKSQGSEFDAVAFVLPHADMPLLTREALYTALTRARKSVVVVGEASLFRAGIERRLVRESGIVERLQGKAAIAGG
jgi:exodeoxyribonuclease V alpha subunit